jgi:ribosomal protein S12 methylthiotransferase accessory factor
MMTKEVTVTFPGGKKVDAHFGEWTINTDQSVENGGENTAPNPFDLFFASLAACAGVYAQDFCHARKLSTDGLAVELRAERDAEKKLFTPVGIDITLPTDFPEKYRQAILKTVNLCTVKKHVLGQLDFDVRLAN